MRQAQTRLKGEMEALGRLKGEFAPQERRNFFGRGSFPIVEGCCVRSAERKVGLGSHGGGGPGQTQRSPCEAYAKPTLLTPCPHPTRRLCNGW